MRHLFRLLVVACVFVTHAGFGLLARGQSDGLYPVFSLAQVREDFDQFRNLIESAHPLVYADRSSLSAALAGQRDRLNDGMSELELFRVLSELVSQVNCGHTSLQLSANTESSTTAFRRYLPLGLQIVNGQLFVIRAPAAQADLRGAELVSVNGLPAREIITRLYASLPADGLNRTRKVKFINRGFSELYHLFVDQSSEFVAEMIRPGSTLVTTHALTGISPPDWAVLMGPDQGGQSEIASHTFANDYARLWVRSFNFYDTAGMQRFRDTIDTFFAELARRKLPALILDLRGNGGGEPRLGAHLLSYLIRQGTVYFKADAGYYPTLRSAILPHANAFRGDLYVLVDGNVFSTNGHLVSLLKFHGIGHLIGEETGGSFTCTSNNRGATLRHSRLRLSYATSTFTTAVEGLPPARGVFPDEAVDPSRDDVLAGRDVVMARALQHITGPTAPPVIQQHPRSQVVAPGAPVALLVEPVGQGPFTYQWRRDGEPLSHPRANGPMLVLERFDVASEGTYDVVVTNAGGTATSRAAQLRLGNAGASQLINLSSRAHLRGSNDVVIAGFVTRGAQPRRVLVRGIGPALAPLGVDNPLTEPHLTLFSGNAPVAENHGWGDGNAELIREVSVQVGAFALPDRSRDTALLADLGAHNYSVHLRNRGANDGIGLIEIYNGEPDDDRALANLSTRARLLRDSGPLITGFVIQGPSSQTVLIRAVGPGLAPHGVEDGVPEPRLAVFAGALRIQDGVTVAASPAPDRLRTISAAVGAFALPAEGTDQVLLTTLQPGAYSAVVEDGRGVEGWVLAEIYDVPSELMVTNAD